MKSLKLLIVFTLLFVVGTGSAMADRRHHHGPRVHFGLAVGPGWGPWYPPPYYYGPRYYPPVIIEPAPPPVYIEQSTTPAPPQTAYWYFCREANGYYPYVKTCPGGWQTVPPTPQG